ncbi:serine-rich adhesin for platelets-like [Anabrus simplex]|uniref:serine-rich adhesin for platelets-like n=1 Tax=Anabrus simplex TaxID=316456 RepID=UPI0035A39541
MTVFQRSGPASTSNSSSTQSSGDSDLISTASSALRRLHFKSAGGSRANKTKHQQPVPKVVIMGSSTTSNSSNNTINTSTDSANTVATMVTVTDGDYESENEKPFNYIDDVLGTTVSLDREDDFFSGSSSEDMHPGPPPPTPLLGACQKEQRFIFIKTEEDDDDDDNENDYTFTLKKTKATVHRSMADDDVVASASPTKKQKPKSNVILPRKALGQNNINHTPPPDLRVDFFSENDSLTPVALVEDSQDVLESSALGVGTNGRNLDLGEVGGERVVLAATSSSVLVKRCGGAGGGVSEKAGASSSQTNISSQPVVNTTTNPLSLAGASSALARHQQSTALC